MDYVILNEKGVKKAAELAKTMQRLMMTMFVLMGIDIITLSIQVALHREEAPPNKFIDLLAALGAASTGLVVLAGVMLLINNMRFKSILHGDEYQESIYIPLAHDEEARYLSELLWELTGSDHQHALFREEPYRLYRTRMLALQRAAYSQ